MNPVRILLVLLALLAIAACGDKVEYDQVANQTQTAAQTPAPAAMPAAEAPAAVEILETMNSGGYTYIRFEKDGKEMWAAGPETQGLAVGDQVVAPSGMLMQNFHANSLDRDFAEIWFVGGLQKADAMPAAGTAPQSGMGGMEMPTMDAAGAASHMVAESAGVAATAKAEGGYTVAEIHGRAAALAGKTVRVRGEVVKFTPNIMRTNWIHLQDGSAAGADGDLTITTGEQVSVGDVITVVGPLSVDKDFGAGYRYAVIIEGAEVVRQ